MGPSDGDGDCGGDGDGVSDDRAGGAAATLLPFGRRDTVLASAEEEEEEEAEGSSSAAVAVAASPLFVVHDVSVTSVLSASLSVAAPDEGEGEGALPPSPATAQRDAEGEGAAAAPSEEDDADDTDDDVPVLADIEYEKSSALLLHSSERFLTAICGNAWIEKEKEGGEKGQSAPFKGASSLPFKAHSAEKFARLGSAARTDHIDALRVAIAGRLPQADKLNALRYALSLLRDDAGAGGKGVGNVTDTASLMTNAALATSLVQMQFRRTLPPPNSILVGRIFGQLFRYSRVITPALSPSSSFTPTLSASPRGAGGGVFPARSSAQRKGEAEQNKRVDVVLMLGEMLEHQNKRIQRSAAASLAELAFYVFKSWELERRERAARAAERGGADTDAALDELEQWFLSRPLVSPLLRCLQPSRDAIVRHYVAKLLENIASQSDFRSGLEALDAIAAAEERERDDDGLVGGRGGERRAASRATVGNGTSAHEGGDGAAHLDAVATHHRALERIASEETCGDLLAIALGSRDQLRAWITACRAAMHVLRSRPALIAGTLGQPGRCSDVCAALVSSDNDSKAGARDPFREALLNILNMALGAVRGEGALFISFVCFFFFAHSILLFASSIFPVRGEDPSSALRAQAQADDPGAEVGGASTPRKLFSAEVPVALLEVRDRFASSATLLPVLLGLIGGR